MNRDKDGNLGDKTFSVVSETKMDSNTTLRMKADVGDKVTITGGVIQKVNENITMKAFDTLQPFQAW